MKTWLLYIEACDPHHFLAGWQVARGEISIVPGARNTLIIIYLGCERKREKAVGGAAAKESDSRRRTWSTALCLRFPLDGHSINWHN